MSATKELRKLLDKCGVEWVPSAWVPQHETYYQTPNGIGLLASEINGSIRVRFEQYVTPEQAVEATVGNVTTRNGKTRKRHGRDVPLCECCGYAIGDARYNFCPSCGAKVIHR